MKRRLLPVLFALLLAAPLAALALWTWMPQAKAAPAAGSPEIAALRARGPAALEELLARHDALWRRYEKLVLSNPQSPEAARLKAEIDALKETIDLVGGQRYCTASRFFWYTDLDQAKAAAEKSGKPILSLRMMGRLTDEYSCANSRFFRTTLYANQEVSQYLRDNFVLHWKSVRPVPKITIDFGDGRKLERTITGNSAHYILDVDGQPLDVLPGLYSPQKFLEELRQAQTLFASIAAARGGENSAEARRSLLVAYHRQQRGEAMLQWQRDLRRIEANTAAPANSAAPVQAAQPTAPAQTALGQARADARPIAPPPAAAAARIARPKALVEMPMIRAIALEAPQLEQQTDDAMWEKIAALHAAEWKLDEASRRVIRSENPTAAQAGRLTVTKALVEDPLVKMVRKLESSIALDTVRNEYQLRRKIHEWFMQSIPADVEQLNSRVYAELFLTPNSDPWIGLVQDDIYTGLDNAGVTVRPSN